MTTTDPTKHSILIADDEPLFGKTTAELLRKAGFEVTWVENGEMALAALNNQRFAIAVVDLNMPGNMSLELLVECRRSFPSMPLVVLTGRPTLPSAIESVRLGIHDYLLKPIEIDDLVHSLRRALPGDGPADAPPAADGILGAAPAMTHLKDMIRKTAQTSANVLIRGESGTGKELVARAIHRQSRRHAGPLVVIDCSALPEQLLESTLFGHVKGAFTGAAGPRTGLIKAADQGTAFFVEIGELPLLLQAKLLRVIQFGTFLPVGSSAEDRSDLRILAATNRDLAAEARAGRFTQDLFYRLAVLEIAVPPLRDRIEDLATLGNAFLSEIAAREGVEAKTLGPGAIRIFERYRWPGNVRELRNVMERLACLCDADVIEAADVPPLGTNDPLLDVTTPSSSHESSGLGKERDIRLQAADLDYLENLLKKHLGNVTSAAREAGLTRQGLHECLKRAGLDPSTYRR